MRLKDATHLIANIAISSTIRLVAQTRQRLLDTAELFAAEQVAAERAHALAIRTATTDLSDRQRLLQRVTQLPDPAPPERRAFVAALALAHKILADRDDPDGGEQVVSTHDLLARRGKHGAYFTGYLLYVALDADGQIITALDVLPANRDEAADASALISHEETVQGNDVQTLSLDKAGFRGELLREWQDPQGLALDVVVPPTTVVPTAYFTAEDFRHDAGQGTLTCPSSVTTAWRTRNRVDTGWKYVFPRERCATCPLQARCLERLPQATGRMIVLNDYAGEYAAAGQKATTPGYQQVRREHPAIERKLAEVVCRHAARRTRYRGRMRSRIQYLLTGLVVNVKRMVRLLLGPPQPKGGYAAIYPIAV
ncbi:MAG TPA: transposase [Roseiflexaceae bacterium]